MKRIVFLLALLALPAWAVEPDERLADPALEIRAREVSKALRCVVCQNETIDDSSAELAKDMRLLVRERITAGDSNEQVLAYIVQRYGDFVLLKPRMTAETFALWFGPFLVLVLGGVMVARRMRKPAIAATPAALSEDETRELKILNKDTAP
jgi:cytochrome c-type biogenesis protein CcmH